MVKKLKVMTPPQFLKSPIPKYVTHHGTCDCCKAEFVHVLHLRYDRQPDSWRICTPCFKEALKAIGVII